MKAVVCENSHENTVEHACYPKILVPRFVNLKSIQKKVTSRIFSRMVLILSRKTPWPNLYLIIQQVAKSGIMTSHKLNLENAPKIIKYLMYVD